MTTPDLVESLVAQAMPVRSLRPPLARALLWLFLAAAVVGLLGLYNGARQDLTDRLLDRAFDLQVGASLLTGIAAAVAAFHISLPDRSRAWILLPLPTLAVWILGIGYGCVFHWIALTSGELLLEDSLRCLQTVVLTSLPLTIVLVIMLRHAARLQPVVTAGAGALATAAIAATALSLLHNLEATVLVFIWNFGVPALMVSLGGATGRRLFSLVTPNQLSVEAR